MSDVAAADFVGGGELGLGGVEGALFLDHDDYAVADAGVAFTAEDFDAFGDCGAGVVDYIDHGLGSLALGMV